MGLILNYLAGLGVAARLAPDGQRIRLTCPRGPVPEHAVGLARQARVKPVLNA